MATPDNFEENYNRLVKEDAIPPTKEHHLSDHIKQTIADLSDDEMTTLIGLAKKTKSHLFLHDKDNHVIAMGL